MRRWCRDRLLLCSSPTRGFDRQAPRWIICARKATALISEIWLQNSNYFNVESIISVSFETNSVIKIKDFTMKLLLHRKQRITRSQRCLSAPRSILYRLALDRKDITLSWANNSANRVTTQLSRWLTTQFFNENKKLLGVYVCVLYARSIILSSTRSVVFEFVKDDRFAEINYALNWSDVVSASLKWLVGCFCDFYYFDN